MLPPAEASTNEPPPSVQKLLAAAHAWAAKTPAHSFSGAEVVVLDCDDGGGSGVPQDSELLLAALRERGVRLAHCSWQDKKVHWPSVQTVLPLGCWDYAASREQHLAFVTHLRMLHAEGVQPQPDLAGVAFCSHKRYLLDLQAAGLPVVPTVLLSAGATECEVAAACARLRSRCTHFSPNGDAVFVCKPALGSRGDGVEKYVEGDASDADALLALLHEHDMLLQPFLPAVASDGEVCCVYVNGELLHAIHKDPRLWASHQSEAVRAGLEMDKDLGGADGGSPPPSRTRYRLHPSPGQFVKHLEPVPPEMLQTARTVLHFIQVRCGAGASPAGTLYLARIDLLPAADGRWLVSEVEIGWPELFLRAQPTRAGAVADALLQHCVCKVTPTHGVLDAAGQHERGPLTCDAAMRR